MNKASLLKITDKQELGTNDLGLKSEMYCRDLGVIWLIPIFLFSLLMPSMSYGQVIQISNIEDLQKIGNDAAYPLDGEYELTQDIDASDTINWNSGAGFQPIGTESNPFTGQFDGKGYKIRNIYINRLGEDYVGLFGVLYGEVVGLGIEDAMVSGDGDVGSLVGKNVGTVTGCYSTGSVSGDRYYVGGLVGENNGTVSNCYITCSVWGYSYVGGLVGYNYFGTVSNGYARGSVTGFGSDIGGLIGYLYEGSLTNTYSTGSVGGSGSSKGGLVGSVSGSPTVTSSYWDTQTSGMSTSAAGEGKTTAQMNQQSTYSGWDFSTVWDIVDGSTYPWLRVLGQPQFRIPVEKDISSLEELNKIGRDWEYPWDGIYHLVNDIDAGETVNWDGGKGFGPIKTFTGKFYGNGYKIRNMYINRFAEDYVGLFGWLYGEVRDLGIKDAMVSGNWSVGNLVGGNGGTVSNCYTTGSMSGNWFVSGLVGANGGTVSNCYAACSVLGNYYVGGLVGANTGTVSNCYATGSVSGDVLVGGLVGANTGTVSNCYATGSVWGDSYIGGLVGYNNFGTVSDSYARGSVTGSVSRIGGLIGELSEGSLTNTYSTGFVGGSGSDKGGLVGYVSGSPTVTSSYWDTQTSGMSSSAAGEGKTTAQMKQQATFVGWDFVNIWGIIQNTTYPYLLWQYVVPNVVGMTQADAESSIVGAGLTVGAISQQCSDTVPAGNVISQDPTSGQQVTPGTAVNLVVSTGPCPVTVPNVVGMTQADAESAITGANLTVGTINQQCSDTVPAGNVINQDPTAGLEVPPGTAVNLVVSTGPCPVTVPNVVGMTQVEAENEITGANLTVGTIIQKCSDTVPAGNVISQSPTSGQQVPPGTAVNLVISTGPCPTIQIEDIEELQKIGNDPEYPLDGKYELTQDIDARDTINWNGGAGFKPIGTTTNPFRGKFDGKGYKITNLYINRPSTECVGLFGYIIGFGGEVKDVGIENAYVLGIEFVGSLGGMNNRGTVTGCYSTGTVLGSGYVGGLLGANDYGMVSGCYSTGTVSGDVYVGGLVGANSGTVSNCYSTGTVSGDDSVGGLMGYNSGTVSSSYWDVETSGQSTSAGGEGKTTAEMKQQATFVGWDFTNIWDIMEQCSYPWLRELPSPHVTNVPDVLGLSRTEAEEEIGNSCLVIGAITEQCSDTVPAGNVISQDPISGQQVAPGTAVNLVISTGPCPVTVPDVVGMTQANAISAITGTGLTVGTVTEQCSDTVPAGNVISQDPIGGVQLPPSTSVNLVVSTGQCMTVTIDMPSEIRKKAGDSIELVVTVQGGSGTIHYQWYFERGTKGKAGGEPIPGANGNTLQLTDLSVEDTGYYWCEISDDYDVVETQHIHLIVEELGLSVVSVYSILVALVAMMFIGLYWLRSQSMARR